MSEAFGLTLVVLGALLFLRLELVFKVGFRRIDEIHAENIAAIDAATFDESMLYRYQAVNDAFYWHLFDLRKWTYAQFFPRSRND